MTGSTEAQTRGQAFDQAKKIKHKRQKLQKETEHLVSAYEEFRKIYKRQNPASRSKALSKPCMLDYVLMFYKTTANAANIVKHIDFMLSHIEPAIFSASNSYYLSQKKRKLNMEVDYREELKSLELKAKQHRQKVRMLKPILFKMKGKLVQEQLGFRIMMLFDSSDSEEEEPYGRQPNEAQRAEQAEPAEPRVYKIENIVSETDQLANQIGEHLDSRKDQPGFGTEAIDGHELCWLKKILKAIIDRHEIDNDFLTKETPTTPIITKIKEIHSSLSDHMECRDDIYFFTEEGLFREDKKELEQAKKGLEEIHRMMIDEGIEASEK